MTTLAIVILALALGVVGCESGSERIAALERRVAQLEERLGKMENLNAEMSSAVSAVKEYREQSSDESAKKALHMAAVAIEAYYGEKKNYAGATPELLTEYGYKPAPGVTLRIRDASPESFVLWAQHESGPRAFEFDSKTGTITPQTVR